MSTALPPILAESMSPASAHINFLFRHRFVYSQDAKLTAIRFEIHVVQKQDVLVGVTDVVAPAIHLLTFAPCLAEHVRCISQLAADALDNCRFCDRHKLSFLQRVFSAIFAGALSPGCLRGRPKGKQVLMIDL